MKTAYFDCFAGISGDMILGALVDSGLALETLRSELEKLPLKEFQIHSKKVEKHGIAATKIDVIAREGHVHRHLQDILDILDAGRLSETVKRRAGAIFRRLAEAEAEVHGVPIERVHFHEVGAVDAIVDVVGAVAGLELLGIEKIYASCLRFGRGVTRGAHGAMPIPVPAVVALCRGLPAERTDIPFELVTPTGAAILTTLADRIGGAPVLRTRRTGYGAGNRDLEAIPNLLRIEIGETDAALETDAPVQIETNIDDMPSEVYAYLIDRLLEAGARDVSLTPIVMKKGRPGITVSVLSDPGDVRRLSGILFQETTTLGVRLSKVDRLMVSRRVETVETPYGPVRVKIAEYEGRTRRKPEHDDCARLAKQHDLPLQEISRAALLASEQE